ncbi:MAG: cysteine hydrolase family protein [Propionivibrio sp.]
MSADNRPALLVIDMQNCMTPAWTGPRNNPLAEEHIAALLSAWRDADAPIVHIRHLSRTPGSPFWPGQSGCEFQPRFAPSKGEHVVEKNVPDAFCRSGLEHWLLARDIENLVIVGVSTNNSVEATARAAGNLGFSVRIVSDATFTFDKPDYDGRPRSAGEVHAMSLANLDGEYGEVVKTAEVLGK